jgi:hypothetical protein
MYNLTLDQNGHFNKKTPTKRTMSLSWHMFLIKMNILLVNVDILIKLNLSKNHDFL